MNLTEKISADLAEAMKKRDAAAVDTLRMLRAQIKNTEIEKGHSLSDTEIVAATRTMIKQLRDLIEEFTRGARADLVGKAEAEIKLLSGFLPPEMTDDELNAVVRRIIGELGASGPQDFGKAMGAAAAALNGRVDGSRLAAIVRAALGSV